MGFWTLDNVQLAEFRPGIKSKVEIGNDLIMACMEIGPGQEDAGHEHDFDQCGLVLDGQMEMFIGQEQKKLGPGDAYFIPAGQRHGYKTLDQPAKVLDVSLKAPRS
jgi:quercetin dioxygenase-like cupin family protein